MDVVATVQKCLGCWDKGGEAEWCVAISKLPQRCRLTMGQPNPPYWTSFQSIRPIFERRSIDSIPHIYHLHSPDLVPLGIIVSASPRQVHSEYTRKPSIPVLDKTIACRALRRASCRSHLDC